MISIPCITVWESRIALLQIISSCPFSQGTKLKKKNSVQTFELRKEQKQQMRRYEKIKISKRWSKDIQWTVWRHLNLHFYITYIRKALCSFGHLVYRRDCRYVYLIDQTNKEYQYIISKNRFCYDHRVISIIHNIIVGEVGLFCGFWWRYTVVSLS